MAPRRRLGEVAPWPLGEPGTRNREVIGWTAYQRGRRTWAFAALHTDTRRTTGDVPRGRDVAARGQRIVENLLESA